MEEKQVKTKAKTKTSTEKPAKKPAKAPSKKKKICSIGLFVVGLIVLVVGIVFLVLNLMKMNSAADGDYLVAAENWVMEGSEGVIWDFTEIGKGTLTTNNHLNDYDFIWALEDGKLLIETDWLYDIDNEYDYSLDQNSGVLTLSDGIDTYKFVAQ